RQARADSQGQACQRQGLEAGQEGPDGAYRCTPRAAGSPGRRGGLRRGAVESDRGEGRQRPSPTPQDSQGFWGVFLSICPAGGPNSLRLTRLFDFRSLKFLIQAARFDQVVQLLDIFPHPNKNTNNDSTGLHPYAPV